MMKSCTCDVYGMQHIHTCEMFLLTDSTAGDITASPTHDESRPEDDDSVFLSPTKSRTTEDLFAMIHR